MRAQPMPGQRRRSVEPRTRTLLVVGALVVVVLATAHQLGRIDRRFFGWSVPSLRAVVHYLAGDYAGAARLYREALRRTLSEGESPEGSAWIAFARGDLELAELQARAEAHQAPGDPEPLLTLAEIALARRDAATALTRAARVLALRRDDYDALLITAVAQARQGAHAPAIAALKRALRYDRAERRITVFHAVLEATGELDDQPGDARPNCLLAHLHRYLRIYDPAQARRASRYARQAIAVGDGTDDAYVTLGVIHTKQGQPGRGFEAVQQALAVNPRNTAALLAAARFRDDRGEIEETERLMRAAVEADRDDAFIAAIFHGFLIARLGDYREGLAFGKSVVARNPHDGEAWWRLGHVHGELGDHGEALRSYRRAARLMPQNPEVQESIGDVLAELGLDEEAFAAYSKAVALDPWRPGPHQGLAMLHGQARRWSEAINELETVARVGGGLSVSLCELYWETGRTSAATGCVTAVLTVDPDNVQGLALMEHVRGARQSARKAR
jgi:tetratricopeptide (TPR) repeat protein